MSGTWIGNLLAYSAQIAVLLAAGGVLLKLLRLRLPAWRLFCWQLLLAACLVLPLLQPWQAADSGVSVQMSSLGRRAQNARPGRKINWVPLLPEILAFALLAGTGFRLGLFGLGFVRLRGYRRRSKLEPGLSRDLQSRLGVLAEIRTSGEIPGPVTFGFLRPVVLLPARWIASEPVLYHELVHVRRRDWLCMAAEEFVRALFWFHPLVWYAVAQIQLAREEVVDREVVKLTQSRERYLETLLAIAAARSGLDLAPAPLFLRKRHLRKRIASLLQEVRMSKIRLNATLAGFAALTLAAGFVAVRAFPLQAAQPAAAAQDEQPTRIRIGGNVQSAKLIKKVTPVYPRAAKEARIQGTVRLNVVIAADGTVKDIDVESGDPALTDASVEAVKQWVYETTLLNGNPVEVATQVDINFTLTR